MIGVFDSGLGGLTVLRALKTVLPNERFLYFGDTAHLPYGDKSPETLRGYIGRVVDYLLSREVKAVVVACNTAAAVAKAQIVARCGTVPVFEVVTPAVEEAVAVSPAGRIGVLATKTTVASHVYLKEILERRPDAFVVEKAAPLLVSLIEEGWLQQPLCDLVVEAYLSDTGFRHIETLILGCTHYPLVKNAIENYFAKNHPHPPKVVGSDTAVAAVVAQKLTQLQLTSDVPDGPDEYRLSDVTEAFVQATEIFFGQPIRPVHTPL
ncbi:MAG: glutamate racemase [Bacteroidia bacterium]|nr:glutamate racemase [Bacteroidia bacterium]MDW8334753.1 glutamate racemase [Bacteroidia bacterium]